MQIADTDSVYAMLLKLATRLFLPHHSNSPEIGRSDSQAFRLRLDADVLMRLQRLYQEGCRIRPQLCPQRNEFQTP